MTRKTATMQADGSDSCSPRPSRVRVSVHQLSLALQSPPSVECGQASLSELWKPHCSNRRILAQALVKYLGESQEALEPVGDSRHESDHEQVFSSGFQQAIGT
eukprot:CAMPEP_0198127980 /NCGR_PEP_ID=MMETSP1442-20131203/48361_1 /TAXON_ID= /ORGANISM="Craspedostauros australis, Strain CCMP3328" /LENGTH=102 /DNA_ID=CAMNT_0043788059 /DNA_START=51 /DNA_END=359 /DNA_ORIENTATION=-